MSELKQLIRELWNHHPPQASTIARALEIIEDRLNPPDKQCAAAPKRKTRGEEVAERMVRADGGWKGAICINERGGNSYVHVEPAAHIDPKTLLASIRAYFAAAIDAEIARERDECAKVAEQFDRQAAAAIRARGETPAQGA